MTDVAVKCEVDGVATEDGGSMDAFFITALLEDLKGEDGRSVLTPATVYADVPYAEYVEFGTGPLPGGKPNRRLFAEISKWAAAKSARTGDKDLSGHETIVKIVMRIAKSGTYPHPFFRSAMYSVLDRECPDSGRSSDYLDSGGSLKTLCDDIRDEAAANLIDNNSIATSTLLNNLKSEYCEDYTVDTSTGEVRTASVSEAPSEDDQLWERNMADRGRKGSRGESW